MHTTNRPSRTERRKAYSNLFGKITKKTPYGRRVTLFVTGGSVPRVVYKHMTKGYRIGSMVQ